MTHDDGTVTTRDGATIAYTLRAAAPGKPNLALIHSLALDRSVWEPVVERIGDAANVLFYDCRGHGASTKSPGPYAAQQFADDLADVMKSIGWDHAVVGGASMGGSMAIAFAQAYPHLVDGLALIDTTAWYGADAPKAWGDRASKAETEGFGSMIAFQQTRWFSDAFRASHPDVGKRFGDIFLASDVAAYGATCRMLGSFDARAGLGAIAVPTEILVGEHDYATPPDMSRELAAAIPGAHLTIVPDARHLTMLEIPDDVARIVRAVLAQIQERTLADRR